MTDIRRRTKPPRLIRPALVGLLLLWGATGCQTPNQGTSEVTSVGQSEHPGGTEPVPHPGESAANAPAHAPGGASLEHDTCRPGADYRVISLDSDDPSQCVQICSAQMRCMALTYRAPARAGDRPQCHLKHSIPDKVTGHTGCVSWVNPRAQRRLALLQKQGFELDTRRPGADFRDFAMDQADPALCQKACQNLRDCKAFTYVRPGQEGDKAHCYLKSDAPKPVSGQDCCISGLK